MKISVMRIISFLLVFLLFSCKSNNLEENVPKYRSFEYSNTSGVLPYRALLPENYDASKSYPLVLILHGAGERGNDNIAQLTHGSSLFLKKEVREKFPAIVVFPQCPEDSYWSNVEKKRDPKSFTFTFSPDGEPTQAMQTLQGLIPDLRNKYKIDQNRMYVGGLSMGGMGTLELVRRNPNMFAAAFSICGGAHPETAPQLTNTKWWFFHGDADVVVDYQYSVNMVNALKAENVNPKFTTYEGVNHNSWENAFAEPELLPWLFTNSK
ncbi:MAG: alpha/beta hydrolase-fold protein [Maribacter sp.]